MNLLWLVGVSSALYLSVRYWLLPRLEKQSTSESLPLRLTRSGSLAAAKFASDVLLLAMIVYGGFGAIAMFLSSAFGNNVTLLSWVVDSATACKEKFVEMKTFYGQMTFVFFVAGFAFLLWKERRKALSDQTCRLYVEEEDRLNYQRESDPVAWEGLPPNERMLGIQESISRLEMELKNFTGEKFHNERVSRIREIKALREKLVREDYQRRVDVGRIEAALKASEGSSPWDVLFSKGFYGDVRLGSKLLKRAATAVAMVALIGVGDLAGMNRVLSGRLIRLDQMRVQTSSHDVKEQWKRGLPPPQQQSELSSDDRATTAYLADQFARALLANPSWQQDAASVSRGTEEALVREAVLSQASLPTQDQSTVKAYEENLSAEEKEAILQTIPPAPEQTRLGAALAESEGKEVKSWFGSRWDDVKHAVRAHEQKYYDPLQTLDMRQNALDAILAREVSGSSERTFGDHLGKDNYFVNQVSSMMDDSLKSQLADFIPTEFHSMLEDFASGKPLDQVLDHVRHARLHVSDYYIHDFLANLHRAPGPTEASIADHLRGDSGDWRPHDGNGPVPHNPTSTGPVVAGGGNGDVSGGEGSVSDFRQSIRQSPPAKVTNLVDAIARENNELFHSPSVNEREVEGLAEYNDFFPNSPAAASNTVLAQEIGTHGGAIAGVAEDTAFRVERAENFVMLEGFSRVGGVLIGREPENSSTRLDLRGLDWNVQGGQVLLTLHDAKGRTTRLGPYDKTLVHQALAYAADGRPVAVTMTTAAPMEVLKVQLHPALLDTPLGCRVSQLDRLVDTFAGENFPQRLAQQKALRLQLSVYQYAWAARVNTLIKTEAAAESTVGQAIRKMLEDKETLALGLTNHALLAPDGVMQLKAQFFDSDLVQAIKSCHLHVADSFGSCIEDQFRNESISEDTVKRYLDSRTNFIPWSGVRERPYRLTEDLSFLQPPSATDVVSSLWPFDFIVQISFTTPALNSTDANGTYVDKDPLELSSLRPDIQRFVYTGIQKNGLGPSLQDLRDFTVLQRLFRTALKGYLGEQFPIRRLAALEHDTAGGIPYFRTARWQGSELPILLKSGAPQSELAEQEKREDALGVTDDVRRMREQSIAEGVKPGTEHPCPSLTAGGK